MADRATELVEFLAKYQWTWEVKLTRFFLDNHWQRIPIKWRETLSSLSTDELAVLPDREAMSGWPERLQEFMAGCRALSLFTPPPLVVRENRFQLDRGVQRGMNPKKQHEVCSLAGYVNHLCQDKGCTTVLDVGSGLGYLGQCLSWQCGLQVTGLERELERVRAALKRSDTIQGRERRAVTSEKQFPSPGTFSSVEIDLDSSSESKSAVKQLLKDTAGRVCLVGLHCCGDLTSSLLSLYAEYQTTVGLCCMVLLPCCYHKLSFAGGDGKWNPLSHTVKDVLCKADCALNICALRLAAQDSRQRIVWNACYRWQARNSALRCRHMVFRGILECVAVRENVLLDRESVRKASLDSFESYLSHILKAPQWPGTDVPALRAKLNAEYSRQQHALEFVQPFLALQACIQRVLESLLLLDCVFFLREHGISAQLVTLFEECISPRCMGIVAR